MGKRIIILGGGPAGYVAAIKASSLGASAILIEEDKLGGTCLNRGCIPTKALFRSAEVYNNIKNSEEFGLKIEGACVEENGVFDRCDRVVEQLRGGIEKLLKSGGIEIIKGKGRLIDNRSVEVLKDGDKKVVKGDFILIASGSRPSVPPLEGVNLKNVLTSNEILELKKIPKELSIVGGGVIGLELASIFNSFGSKIKIFEFLPNILAMADSDIYKRLPNLLKRRGIEVNTSTAVKRIDEEEGRLKLTYESKGTLKESYSDYVLFAAGRRPNVEGIGLEEAGIEFGKKGIIVDENYRTNLEGVYAVGDVNGLSMLAHSASFQAEMAVAHMILNKECKKSPIPSCVFSFPEIAWVGITEDEAKNSGIEYKTSKFMMGASGKALAMGEAEGFIKTVGDKDGRVLGAHIIGPNAAEIVQEAVMAINMGLKSSEFEKIIFAHPTLSEAFKESALGLDGLAVHMVNKN